MHFLTYEYTKYIYWKCIRDVDAIINAQLVDNATHGYIKNL